MDINVSKKEQMYFNKFQKRKQKNDICDQISLNVNTLLGDSYTSLLSCIKCSSNDVSYEHKQTRAMDEGMTTFFTCRTCQTKWKE